jgi:hypothetical protein
VIYIRLFHGRKCPGDELNDWGREGPILGPFEWAHMTYASDIKLGVPNSDDFNCLEIIDDLIWYDGVWYGDASFMTQEEVLANKSKTEGFCQKKAELRSNRPPP